MKRGDVTVIAAQGDHGKPRPAVIVQTDLVPDDSRLVAVLPITRDIQPAPLLRVTVEPSAENGLKQPSQVMTDAILTVRRDKVGKAIGSLDAETMLAINRTLAVFLGLT